MSLVEFQHALSQLVMSPPFRTQVQESPGEALAGFELSPRERERLETMARDPGLRTGTIIHRSFRLSMLSNTLPRTCKALGQQGIKDMAHAYWQEQPSRSLLYVREGLRFAEWALARMRREGYQHPLLPEVLEAEAALLELTREELWNEEPEGSAGLEQGLEGRTLRLHPHCQVVRFRTDPEVVLAELKAGRVPEGLEEGEHYFLARSTSPGQVVTGQVSPEAGRVLLACAGPEGARYTPEMDEEMVRELVEEGYLRILF